jgi:hypothetical protein
VFGYERFGGLGLIGGFLAGLFLTSMTVGILFVLLEMNQNLRRLVELMEQQRTRQSGGS